MSVCNLFFNNARYVSLEGFASNFIFNNTHRDPRNYEIKGFHVSLKRISPRYKTYGPNQLDVVSKNQRFDKMDPPYTRFRRHK